MEDLRPGPLLGLAGFLVMGAGLSMLASSAQLIIAFPFTSIFVAAWPYATGVLGIATLMLGGYLTKGRDWAAFGALLSCGVGLLGGLIWIVYALASGLFTLVSVFALGMCLLGLLFTPLCIPRALKLSSTRRALLKGL